MPLPLPKKSLGQNFLIHEPTVQKIAGLVCQGSPETVIELGAGTGLLTQALAKLCKRVVALEIDERLIRWHQANRVLPKNVELRRADILKIDYQGLSKEIGGMLRIAGNLPYNISTQVVFATCSQRQFIEEAHFLFQKEVAERIISPPGRKSYGIISVVSQYCADLKKELDIPPSMFKPSPKVYSSLVRFRFVQNREHVALDYKFFVKTIKASFSQRRKKIINCLCPFFKLERQLAEKALEEAGINPDIRAERLDVDHFVSLSNRLKTLIDEQAPTA